VKRSPTFRANSTIRVPPDPTPEDGDLIYYKPWQNLGFNYSTSGIGHSDQTIHIGRYDATAKKLAPV
jgi:hypothetical protein